MAQTAAEKKAAEAQAQRDPETVETAAKADTEATEGQRADTEGAEAPATGTEAPKRTLLDTDVSMPGYEAPGDAPYDTVDPTEHASSVQPDKGNAARQGFGVVNAVVPIPNPQLSAGGVTGTREDRVERVVVSGPTGKPVTVERNIDAGTSRVVS